MASWMRSWRIVKVLKVESKRTNNALKWSGIAEIPYRLRGVELTRQPWFLQAHRAYAGVSLGKASINQRNFTH